MPAIARPIALATNRSPRAQPRAAMAFQGRTATAMPPAASQPASTRRLRSAFAETAARCGASSNADAVKRALLRRLEHLVLPAREEPLAAFLRAVLVEI